MVSRAAAETKLSTRSNSRADILKGLGMTGLMIYVRNDTPRDAAPWLPAVMRYDPAPSSWTART